MRMATVFALALLAVNLMAAPVFAQGDAPAEQQSLLKTYLVGGGTIGFVIILFSVVSLALVIEHIVNIKRDKIVPPDLIDEIEGLFENEEYQEALELCESPENQNFLTNVLAAGLPKINAGFETMKAAMDERGEEEAIRLQQKIGYLSLIANIAPMLGLFGTVSGMIEAFQTIAAKGASVTPADLANGISKALVTTFLGLLVAIPTMVAYFFFRNKVVRVTLEINGIADELVERFRGK
jgi:biopolymer transport protein ExbB